MSQVRSGWLVMNKAKGMTSFDVCNRVRTILRRAGWPKRNRVGHAGTLDPLATGVLLVGVGRTSTRLIDHMKGRPKEYRGVVRFGMETATFDSDGDVIRVCEEGARLVPSSGEEEGEFRRRVEGILAEKFSGALLQTPPVYSAIKVQGRRLYDYARAGQDVAVPTRTVHVHDIRLTRLLPPDSIELEIRCSPGTYIRSIAQDLGRELTTCGGHLTALTRTAIGEFTLEGAIDVADLSSLPKEEQAATLQRHLLPPEVGVAHLPTVDIAAEQWAHLSAKRHVDVPLPAHLQEAPPGTRVSVRMADTGAWLGVAEPSRGGGLHLETAASEQQGEKNE